MNGQNNFEIDFSCLHERKSFQCCVYIYRERDFDVLENLVIEKGILQWKKREGKRGKA